MKSKYKDQDEDERSARLMLLVRQFNSVCHDSISYVILIPFANIIATLNHIFIFGNKP